MKMEPLRMGGVLQPRRCRGSSCTRLALFCAALLAPRALVGQPAPEEEEAQAVAAECFQEGTVYTFEICCHLDGHVESDAVGFKSVNFVSPDGNFGNPDCWSGPFNYKVCCKPEIEARTAQGIQLIKDGKFREASEKLFDVSMNYANLAEGEHSWQAWSKAVKEYKAELEKAPFSVSYHELVFGGHGIDCPEVPGESVVAAQQRCCTQFFEPKNCNTIFELAANALGWGRHKKDQAKKDDYYKDMSEAWAFHHFTPSVLMSVDGSVDGPTDLEKARSLDRGLAGALSRVKEPSLGILWADTIDFMSPKYMAATMILTRLFLRMRLHNETGLVDFMEVGAGYGSVPRMLAAARPRLLEEGFGVRSYTIFDLPFVIHLQRWYLNRTMSSDVELRDWIVPPHEAVLGTSRSSWGSAAWEAGGATSKLWPEVGGGLDLSRPLRVDFVDPDHRDLFAHLFSAAHAHEEAASAARPRPRRVLLAVNSWHEFVMEDFLWYYNHFVVAPAWQMGVDWIVYVSNRGWKHNDLKEALLLEPRPHYGFDIDFEECSEITCFRILRRRQRQPAS